MSQTCNASQTRAMALHYVRAIEILLTNYVIGCLGLLLSRIKIMTADEARLILLITGSVSIPCMIFREVGQHTLHEVVWRPLFVAISVQVVLHVVVFLLCFCAPARKRWMLLLRTLLGTAYTEFLYFGAPFIQIVFGEDLTYVAVQCAIASLVIVRPLHSFYIYWLASRGFLEADQRDLIPRKNDEEEENELEDGLDHGIGAVHPVRGEEESHTEGSSSISSVKESSQGEEESLGEGSSSISPVEDNPPAKLWRVIVTNIFTPRSLCLFLGLIWSAIEVTMPVFLDNLTHEHEKALMSPGLFTTGVYIFYHPLIRGPATEITICSLVRVVALPLLAMFFSWCYGLEARIAAAVTILHAMPCGVTTYHISKQLNIMNSSPTYVFAWTNIISVAVVMLWVCILNETHVFGF